MLEFHEAQQYPNSGADNQSTKSVVYGDGKQTPIVLNRGDSVSETINVDKDTEDKDKSAPRKNFTETFSQFSGSPQNPQGQRLVLPERDEAHSPTTYEPNMKRSAQAAQLRIIISQNMTLPSNIKIPHQIWSIKRIHKPI